MGQAWASAFIVLESPDTTESTSSEFAPCTKAAKTSPAGISNRETFLPKLSATEMALVKIIRLVLAKPRFWGGKIPGPADAHQPTPQPPHTLLFCADMRESPLER